MQYMFSVLVLGDSSTAIEYTDQANLQNISQDQEFSKWGTHLTFSPDECDFELSIPVGMPNFDAIIPASDSILYFLNPNSASEVEMFKEIMNTIQKVRRDIPTVVIFRDQENFISLPTNQLLSIIWESYPFEAYIADYGTKNQMREILETIATALMKGEILINYNTAWLQIPILSKNANLNIIAQNWSNAARMAEKIAKINEKLGIMDQNIYAEQAAWLYAKAGDLLKASNVIKGFNQIFAERYRRMYTDYLMNEGHQLNREKKFAQAALKYESAGNWAKLELSDPPLMKQMYQFAIFAWIAACNIKNAFVLLENFDHNEMIQLLEKTTQKIAGVADFLIAQGQGELAKIQIYLSFEQFQKAGLFDSIKVLGEKAIQILKTILENELQQNDFEDAKSTYDEITNMWDTYEIKRENMDPYLEKIVRFFIIKRDFPLFEALLPKIESLDIQKTLTDERMKEEEKIKSEVKQGELKDQTIANEILLKYVKEEAAIFYEMNKNVFTQAEKLNQAKEFVKAAQCVKRQADWLRFIGQERLSFDVLEYELNINLQANAIGQFLNEVQLLPEERRKTFLKKATPAIQSTFAIISEKTQQAEFESLINTIIHLFRNLLLYEESRIFAEVYINNLIHHGALIASHPDEKSIQQSLEITRKIDQITKSYLENRSFDLDSIYSKVIEFYIEKKDLVNARAYNDKLKNKNLAVEYNGRVEKIESQHSGEAAQKAKEIQEMKIFADKLHSLKILSRDQKMAQPNLVRMRLGLKRRYFQEGIDKILVNDLLGAITTYVTSTIELAKSKKFELAGVNMAVIGIISLLNKSTQLLFESIGKVDQEIGPIKVVFHETYQMKVLDYLSQMVQNRNSEYLKEALKLLEVLPFFPEEQLLLDVLLGNGNIGEKLNEFRKQTGIAPVVATGTNHSILINKLEYDQGIFNRRQIYESKYWSHCQDHFAKQNYDQASTLYLGHIEEFILRKSEKVAAISVVMGFLCLLKTKSGFDTYKEFEKFYFRLTKQNEALAQYPEIKLLDLFLSKFESKSDQNMIREISDALQTRLALYDWERSFISSLFTHDISTTKASASSANSGIITAGSNDNQDDDSLLTQQIVVLSQQFASMKKDLAEIKNKRELGRRIYYNEIFEVLKTNNFEDASEKYLSLTKRMARRNDYDLGSLMVLFSTLCRIKIKHPLDQIKSNINEVLKSLGIVEKILAESIGVKLSYFVLDALNSQNDSIKQSLKNILRQIPYLDEEYNLIQL